MSTTGTSRSGQLLGIVQPTGPEAQLAQANADVTQARAQYAEALAQVQAARQTAVQAADQAAGRPRAADQGGAGPRPVRGAAAARPQCGGGTAARPGALQRAPDRRAGRRRSSSGRHLARPGRGGAPEPPPPRTPRSARARPRCSRAKVTLGNQVLRAPVAGQAVKPPGSTSAAMSRRGRR